MKKLITLLLLMICVSSFAQYSYNGNAITEAQFNKLFEIYSKNIFTYRDEFYNLADENGKPKEYSGESGFANGKITDIDKKNKNAIAEISTVYGITRYDIIGGIQRPYNETKHKTTYACIINLKEEDFQEKINLPLLKLDKVKENYTNKIESYVDLLARLNPITKKQFADYLNKGNVFYFLKGGGYTKTSENIPCTRCLGKGKITNLNYDRKKMNPETLKCPACGGSKFIIKESNIYTNPERTVFQP